MGGGRSVAVPGGGGDGGGTAFLGHKGVGADIICLEGQGSLG